MANEFVARNGIISLQSSQITGSLNVTSGVTASLFGTASYADVARAAANISGSKYLIPVFSDSSSLVGSTIYQSGSFTAINHFTGPEVTGSPEILYLSGEGVDTFNILSAHSDRNGFIQINIQNYNNSTEASSDIVATADNGDDSINYIDMGINSSGFTNVGNVGGQNDAYVYSTGENLYIGNASSGKEVIIFNGGLDAANEAKVWIHDQGTVGINTATYNVENPPSLQVNAINDATYNIAQFYGNTNNYSLLAITNESGGPTASADLALYNNIDPTSQLAGYVDLGINSTNYVDQGVYPGKAGDAYLFTDSHHLVLGTLSGSGEARVTIFAGGISESENAKLILYGNNNHVMTGSLKVTQGVTASVYGTSSWATNALTASYILGGSSTIAIQDEGSAQGSAGTINFTGAGVTATVGGGIATVNIPGGATSAFPYSGSAQITGSLGVTGSIQATQGFTGSLQGTSSWSTNSSTASYAPSYVLNSVTQSMLSPYTLNSATSSGTVLSASYSQTSSYSPNYVLNSVTQSMLSPYTLNSATSSGTVLSSSYAQTASYAPNYVLTSVTQSMLSPYVLTSTTSSGTVLSSSYAQTASYAPNYVLTSTTSSMLSAYTLNSATSSGTVLSSSYAQTASYAPLYLPLTGGTVNGNIIINGTASIGFLNVSYESSSVIYSSGSNQFGDAANDTQTLYGTVLMQTGPLIITGSTISVGGFTGSLVGTSSWATNAITASYAPSYVLNSVTQSMLSPYTLNSDTSSGTVLSSSYAQTASYAPSYVLNSATSSMLSPYTLNSATSSGTVLSSSYAQTSSLSYRVSGSMTGSLQGTSSWASNSVSASYVSSSNVYGPNGFNTILSSSYSLSSSYALNGGVTQIVAGTNVTLSPTNGLGAVTINAGGGGSMTIAEEGVAQGTATFLNFIGSGVTATVTSNTGSITISSGGGLTMKSGTASLSNFSGNPKKATITFTTTFGSTNYGITVTGEDARSWTIESKLAGSFVINSNSNTALTGTTYWHAIAYGES